MQIAKYYNISYEKFFPSIGMSYANFRGNAKKTPINSDTLAILLTKYENINTIWLLTGEGEMLLSSENNLKEISKDSNIYERLIKELEKRIADKEEIIKSLREQIELLKRLKPTDVPRDDGAEDAVANGFSDK